MRKSWRLWYELAFSNDQAQEKKPRNDIVCDGPDPVEIFRNRETSVSSLRSSPMELDHWINLYLSEDLERLRYAHLFHDISQLGGNPAVADTRIYHGRIDHLERSERLSIWLKPPQDNHRVYFDVPDGHDDLLREWSTVEWQALLEDLQGDGKTVFIVGSFYREEWHTLRYLASSPSLIRTR